MINRAMGYGIFRVEKVHRSGVRGIEKEHMRDGDSSRWTGDIDDSMTPYNRVLIQSQSTWQIEINRQLRDAGLKQRKNSVVMLDAVFTASPEEYEKGGHLATASMEYDYFLRCYEWYVKHICQGDSMRVLGAVIHYDETTPHLHISSVPIVRDKAGNAHLSAKRILGDVHDYRDRQDSFYDEVSSEYGLERGLSGGRHMSKGEYILRREIEYQYEYDRGRW